MALNTKGKKTSLTEEASIYQKRQDDLSDKERIKNMTGKQKRDFFKTYYLPKLLVILAVAGVVFYIVWVDFINKSHIYMRCAILNESITDSTLTEFSDRFTDSMKMDYKKNRASFYMYYTARMLPERWEPTRAAIYRKSAAVWWQIHQTV